MLLKRLCRFSWNRVSDRPQIDGFTLALYTCITVRFEWDREKNRINQQKHGGLAFEIAARVFENPAVVFRRDLYLNGEHAENKNDEQDTVRIISAREADKRERRIYLQQTIE